MPEGTKASLFKPEEIFTRYGGVAMLSAAVGVYLAGNLLAPLLPGSFLGAYVLRPVLWLGLALAFLLLPHCRPAVKMRLRGRLVEAALVVAVVQIALAVVLGAVEGFGRSPYSFSPRGILVNLFSVGGTLVGIECSRAYIVSRLSSRHPVLAVALVTLLYAFFLLPLAKLTRLGADPETVRFAATTVLPGLAESLFATVAAYLGGVLPALAYRGLLEACRWFCPVLPNLSWATAALLGTLAPAVGVVFLVRAFAGAPGRPRREKGDGIWGWMATAVVSVVLIWFSLGLFKVFPTVVISGSMRPTFQVGDVVLVLRVPPEKIEERDVICFRQGQLPTVHRAIEIKAGPGGRVFVTKGDANRCPDPEPVLPAQVRGKVVGKIPKLGWVSMALKGMVGTDRHRSPL
ncbi:MAG: signal peptidase I [Bacillota bacterium]